MFQTFEYDKEDFGDFNFIKKRKVPIKKNYESSNNTGLRLS